MKTVVIGGCGLIGSAIVDVLLDRGDAVKVMDLHGSKEQCDVRFGGKAEYARCDILDCNTLDFSGCEEVYNLAGMLGTSELNRKAIDAVRVNIIGALNVFDAAITLNVPRVFYPSKPNVWLNTYTITKQASERFAELYNNCGSIKVSSLRLFNVYGPGQHLYPVRKIVPVFALQAMHGIPIQIYGTGRQTVDMVYVEDVAELIVRATREGITEIIECGRGIPVSVNEVADQVNDYFGRDGVKYLPMRDGESLDTKLVADTERLRHYFPDFKFSDYYDTLDKTLCYYAHLSVGDKRAALDFYGFKARF